MGIQHMAHPVEPLKNASFRPLTTQRMSAVFFIWSQRNQTPQTIDGRTYSNSCFAEAAGVEIDHEGECL